MNELFADSFFYFALLNPADAAHQRAKDLSARLTEHVVTTSWVLQEVADGLCQPPSRSSVLRLIARIEEDAFTHVIEPTPQRWNAGLALYRARSDKAWSLTDCISFEVMRERGLTEALTGDRHFEQAGFIALLNRGE